MRTLFLSCFLLWMIPATAQSDSLNDYTCYRVNRFLTFTLNGDEAEDWKSRAGSPVGIEVACSEQKDSAFFTKIYQRSGIFYMEDGDSLTLYKVLFTNTRNSLHTPLGELRGTSSEKRFIEQYPHLTETRRTVTTDSGKPNNHYFLLPDADGRLMWHLVFSEERLAEVYLLVDCVTEMD